MTLYVDFAASPAAEGVAREWYLEVTGTHVEAAGGAEGAKAAGGAELPGAFALSPARPSPFTGRTTLAFDLPRRARVRLEVFDVLGRRVALLADRDHEPGRYALEWDGRTAAGDPAKAGVYLCRLSTGPFRTEQRLVLLR